MGRLTGLLAGVALMATLGTAMGTTSAHAASCRALEAQLASVGKRRTNSRAARRYERAVARQKRELSRTRSMARRAGCRGPSRTSTCKRLNRTIADMVARADELDVKRRKALGGSNERSKRALKRRMKRQGCGAERSARRSVRTPATKPAKPARVAGLTRPSVARPNERSAGGLFRTICVRTADGYYFPISNATSMSSFRQDAKRCAAMCPTAETKLFVHRVGDEVDTMVDRVGRSYASMPYAFRHRQPDHVVGQTPLCGRPAMAANALGALRGSTSEASPASVPPVPTGLGGKSDTETERNRAVTFGWSAAREVIARAAYAEATPRPVRVVGPRYFPDQ